MEQLVKLYIDIDDVIINTGETFINYYCKKNNIDKTFYDLKDYNFRSIDRNIKKEEFFKYIKTDEFFNNVKLNEDFLRFYMKKAYEYIWCFVTVGEPENLRKKKDFLYFSLPTTRNIEYIGLRKNEEKIGIDMHNGIQIDDYYKNLYTNAKYKILIKNLIETDYNQLLDLREDVYIINTFDEAVECIEFFKKEIMEEKEGKG